MTSPASRSLWRLFRRRGAAAFALCALGVPIIALVASSGQDKQYESTSVLLFVASSPDSGLFAGSNTAGAGDSGRRAATNLGLVELDTVSRRAARALGSGWTPDEVRSRMSIVPDGESDLVEITGSSSIPSEAARLANVYAREFVAYSREADRAAIEQQLRLLRSAISTSGEQSDADLRQLRRREEQLGVAAALHTGRTRLVQDAREPTSPVSPRPKRNAAFGLLLGVLLGIILAVLRIRTDRRVRSAEQASELIERPVLAEYPRLRSEEPGNVDLAELRISGQMLLANLGFFAVDEPVRTVLVTSSAPREGKSTVTVSLAFAAAEAGRSVLLLESDLRRPTLAGRVGVVEGQGLSDVLSGRTALDDAIRSVPLPFAGLQELDGGPPTIDILTAGAIPPNPADLLASRRMQDVLANVQTTYELIVIDTAPTGTVPDSIPVLSMVDGVLVVCRIDLTSTDDLIELRQQLTLSSARILGLVANAEPSTDRARYEYYGYSYTEKDKTVTSKA